MKHLPQFRKIIGLMFYLLINVTRRQAEPKFITPRRLIVSINFLSEQPPSRLKVARPYAQKQCSDCFCVGRLRLNMCQVIS